ncbi:histidine kinase [Nostoc linckia z18]|uniref:Histidine kinase n=2 Tax=Nostoc linckia TaxID=92942 RepID=A0A9Q6EJ23_NOSLI|nr:general stress protein [Nostoc linckia]PHK39354.1 histidine kinase [Nostoc linckia z15]PHK43807.1 histidine kinase [Nostoc linckia z16]PHJ61660.1 histidine kinase [Nostoc linckia z2]PHJ65716.1 histidine kinase [Nostoc linckia z1]PHJ70509.1 histidine kinase [Nostoc linckia z3]
MVVGVHKRAVGVFSTRRDVEHALHELKNVGFDMNRVSVITRDGERDDIAGAEVRDRVGDKSDEGAAVGAVSGGALGGLTGLLVGLGTLAIPGIGPIMLAGATATALATTLAGAGIGAVAGSLLGALIGLGIPEERARVYDERVKRGQYLVIVDGTDAEIARAEAILRQRGIEEFGIYDRPDNVHSATGVAHRDAVSGKYAVGYFSHRPDAEAAISDLRKAGFPLSQISLIHRDSSRRESFPDIHLSDRWDSNRWTLPDNRTHFYNERINQGDYVIVVNGSEAEIQRAAAIISQHGIQQWQIFDASGYAPGTTAVQTGTTPVQATKRAIGVFAHRRDAEAAITELRDAGFPTSRISVIAKDTDGHGIAGVDNRNIGAGNKADEGAKAGAATGGVLGGLTGLLVGLGTLAIPGIGPVIAGGAAATAIATTLAGGAIGAAAGGIVGALVGLGIPEDRARVYNERFQRGDYLVIVDGTEAEIYQAEPILNRRGIQEFGIYDATDLGEYRSRFDQGIHRTTGGDRVNYSTDVHRDDPAVVIVDRREEII